MNRKAIVSAVLAVVLCVGMSVTAYASNNPFAELEAISRQALDVAVLAGTVPEGTTIFDCTYTTDDDGITRVVRYRDKDGNVIDVTTGEVYTQQDKPTFAADSLSEETLAEYADEVFSIVNDEREAAGLSPLDRSDYLEDAAQIRAEECASMNSIRYNGQAHTRPDGSRWFTVFGITDNYNYGENTGQGKDTADAQMASWMASDGHRANVLRDDYTEIGIGVAVSEQGKVFAVQIFSRP